MEERFRSREFSFPSATIPADSASSQINHVPAERYSAGRLWRSRWWWQYVILGLLSLLWFVARTGSKPGRINYPCQRMAAANGFGFLCCVSSVCASVQVRDLVFRGRFVLKSILLTAGVVFITAVVWGGQLQVPGFTSSRVQSNVSIDLPHWTSPSAISDVFAVDQVPVPMYSLDGGTVPAGVEPADALSDAGVDDLVDLMSAHGLKFYKTASQPTGLFGASDVVVIKVNRQWNGNSERARAHTNTDVVKGLIYRLVQHPDGFSGAVIIGENTQYEDPHWDGQNYNNAEDPSQSYQDVVDAFVSEGYDVCLSDWSSFVDTYVGEFSAGDDNDGYVLIDDPGEPGTNQLSYPKFSVNCGSKSLHVSMGHGIWNGSFYDNNTLKMINLPILKRHCMVGSTISVKNYIGFTTVGHANERFGSPDEMHGFFWGYEGYHPDYGLLGRQIARVRRAELNIVDAIWIDNCTNSGACPQHCIRPNILLASTDPVALDYYASVHVLVPLIDVPEWRAESDASNHGSLFRNFLLCNENRLRQEGVVDTIDLDDSYTQAQEEAQFNVYVNALSFTAEYTSYAPHVVKEWLN